MKLPYARILFVTAITVLLAACNPGGTSEATDISDTDNDSSVDNVDNCVFTANAGQADADGDGMDDACDVSQPLNDTGLTTCGDFADNYNAGYSGDYNNSLDCAAQNATKTIAGTDTDGDPVPAAQDALFGRDATHNDNSDGHAGFSFTKLTAEGTALADQSESYAYHTANGGNWSCVRDNVTGLTWEVKQGTINELQDEGLHDADSRYTWYHTDSAVNGGDEGGHNKASDRCTGGIDCNTDSFVNKVNQEALCGYSDWRLPTPDELLSIVSSDRKNPSIDTDYFPNTMTTADLSQEMFSAYWTVATDASVGDSDRAWVVDFIYGNSRQTTKTTEHSVRLVRSDVASQTGAGCDAPTNFQPFKPDVQYQDNHDGTVTDNNTGLMWSKCSVDENWIENTPNDPSDDSCEPAGVIVPKANWNDAMAKVLESNSNQDLGYSDWRVPNRNELGSLIDNACTDPAVNTNLFPGITGSTYWTSSIAQDNGDDDNFVSVVFFGMGEVTSRKKDGLYYLHLVRDDQ